jgi:integrase/recombinase XerD
VTALAPTLQAFFTDRLIRQRHASPETIAAYRDTWRLLLAYATAHTGRQPAQLDIADLDAPLIGDFLDHLERDRGNSARTRNARLAAIHSLFGYAALQHPEHAGQISRVLAIPPKKFDRALVTWLTEPEVQALLAAPGTATRAGRRDRAMILLAAQTGLRISELTGLTCGDVHLGTGPHVSCHGKGRKQRITPLTKNTVAVLRAWMAERAGQPGQPLFPSRSGGRLSRDAVEKRLARHVASAREHCPSLRAKTVTMHVLRHTCAMNLLQAGTDVAVIALWLGHEQAETAQIYLNSRELHQTGERTTDLRQLAG